ncbi:hypothetical protein [Streptomyces sp. NPDC005438]|uniref:hypothetical protein n=1 Tax=Streptomyces sp. NPDC005438 TaxID=3156880 RepID=UPI0033A1D38F
MAFDLTAADLTGIRLEWLSGVQVIWSPDTIWPFGVADRIRASSLEVDSGVFLVRLPVDGARKG